MCLAWNLLFEIDSKERETAYMEKIAVSGILCCLASLFKDE